MPIQFWDADGFEYAEIFLTYASNEPEAARGTEKAEDFRAENLNIFDRGGLFESDVAAVPCAGPWDTECIAQYERNVLGLEAAESDE